MDYKELINDLRKKSIFNAIIFSNDAADAIETLLEERETAVKIVRCKDCKYCILTGRPPFMFHVCNQINAIRAVDEDDFCKYGTTYGCNSKEE